MGDEEMPTYGYSCRSCGHEFEQFQSMKDKPLRTCPACGKKTLKRLIGVGGGIIFKGSGFYETDYRSDSYKTAAKKEKEAATDKKPASDSNKSTATHDSKPTAKKDQQK
jgi:putative FmdB family regulatory protein